MNMEGCVKMKVKLPLCERPPMVANQFVALPLSIIFTQPQKYEDWFYNEFTQLYGLLAMPSGEMQIKLYSPLEDGLFDPLESVYIPFTRFDLGEDAPAFYRLLLKNGYYIRTFCNIKYFSALQTEYDFVHDFLLFGFDDNAGTFDVRAYQDGYLKDFQVSFDEMNQGHLHADYLNAPHAFITTYRLKDFSAQPVLDCFSWRLMDYLGGINTRHREEMINYGFDPCYWGMRIYELFDRFFDLFSAGQAYIGKNSLYTFYEHKQHMQNKCRRFSQNGMIRYSDALDQQLGEICDTAMRCVSFLIKMEIKDYRNVDRDIQSLKRTVQTLKEQELQTYNALCRLNGWYVERG